MPDDVNIIDDPTPEPVGAPSDASSEQDDLSFFMDGGRDAKAEGGDQSSPPPVQPPPAEYNPGDSYLAATARQLGFTPDDVAAYGSDRALKAAVDREIRYRQAFQHQQTLQQQQHQQRPQQPNQGVQLPPWKNPFTGMDDVDPRLAPAIDEVNKYYQGILGPTWQTLQGISAQQQQLVQFVNGIQQQAQHAEQSRVSEAMYHKADSAISALPESYERFVGKADAKGNARDPQFSHVHDSLIRTAYSLAANAGVDPQRMTQPEWNKFVVKAAHAEFHDQIESLAQQTARQQLNQKGKDREALIQPRQATSARRTAPRGKFADAEAALEARFAHRE